MTITLTHYIQEKDLAAFIAELNQAFNSEGVQVSSCVNPSPCFFGAGNGAQRRYTHLVVAEKLESTIPLARGIFSEGMYEFDVNTEMPSSFRSKLDKIAFDYL